MVKIPKKIITEAIIFGWNGTLYDVKRRLLTFSERDLKKLSENYDLGLVAASRNGEDIMRRVEDLGIDGLFDSIEIGDGEIEKSFYIDCMTEMRTLPEYTAVIDHRAMDGIRIGNELGCRTYWVRNGNYSGVRPNKKTGEPTRVVDSLKELSKIFKGI